MNFAKILHIVRETSTIKLYRGKQGYIDGGIIDGFWIYEMAGLWK